MTIPLTPGQFLHTLSSVPTLPSTTNSTLCSMSLLSSSNDTAADTMDLTITELRQGLEAREYTCWELCKTYLARIEEVNDRCHAVIEVNPDLENIAKTRDQDYQDDVARGRLHGIPILIKDLFSISETMDCTAGSLALVGARMGVKSTVIQKLEDSGAIILGRANLSEWANLRSDGCPDGWSAIGGQCYGVYAERQNPSGSSSGSAVAARLSLAAACIGTENNGSITSPAAQAGCIGMKPTVGLVSRTGMISFNEYQDCPGVLARSVQDAAEVLSVICGKDATDDLTASIPSGIDVNSLVPSGNGDVQSIRLAVPRSTILDSIEDKEILRTFDAALEKLRGCGATIVDNVAYPSWTRAFSRQSIGFVWAQLKHQLNKHLSSLKVNPHEIVSIEELMDFMRGEVEEKCDEFGITRMIKAASGEPIDFEKDFAGRFAKGSEITTVLDDNTCDAIIVPEGCRNPSDLGQAPVICLPLGFYPRCTPVEVDETGLTIRGPGMPFGVLLIGRKWDEKSLLSVASAYEHIMKDQLLDQDRLHFSPKTTLQDIIQPKVEGSTTDPSVIPTHQERCNGMYDSGLNEEGATNGHVHSESSEILQISGKSAVSKSQI